MTPGKLIYHLYHKPIGSISKTLKTGVRRSIESHYGRRQMMKAATNLKEVTYLGEKTYKIYFLTGKKYWYQTAFCLYSLQLCARVNISAVIVDDGSFDDQLEAQFKSQFPSTVNVIRKADLEILLEANLPENEFPVLRNRRLVYPHIRKLTDIHILPGDDPKLVLDSDMLFFNQPQALLNWLASPHDLLFMRDVKESYGYSIDVMLGLTGADEIPDRLNVGVAGIPSGLIDWNELEYWTDELLKREGSSYLQEQALTAMIAAGRPITFLNEEDYKVLPLISGSKIPEKLHHYVAEAKYDYFVKGWKHFRV